MRHDRRPLPGPRSSVACGNALLLRPACAARPAGPTARGSRWAVASGEPGALGTCGSRTRRFWFLLHSTTHFSLSSGPRCTRRRLRPELCSRPHSSARRPAPQEAGGSGPADGAESSARAPPLGTAMDLGMGPRLGPFSLRRFHSNFLPKHSRGSRGVSAQAPPAPGAAGLLSDAPRCCRSLSPPAAVWVGPGVRRGRHWEPLEGGEGPH